MERSFKAQWSDFRYRFGSYSCPFCNNQKLGFDNPKSVTSDGINAVAVSCSKCGHIEMFDVEVVKRIANEVDQESRDNGWR